MAVHWDRTLDTFVLASGAAHPTLMYWRLQVFFLIHGGSTGAGSCWGAGSSSCSGYCSGSVSLSTGASVAPSLAAPADAVFLEGDKDIHVHCQKLRRESRDSGSDLCDGSTVTCCGRRKVRDGIHCLLLEVPAVRVCGGIVRGSIGAPVLF